MQLVDALGYDKKCRDRVQSVKDLIASNTFNSSLLVGAISSIPRWEFLRVLNTSSEKRIRRNNTKGAVTIAMDVLFSKTEEVFSGKHNLTSVLTAKRKFPALIVSNTATTDIYLFQAVLLLYAS